MCLANIYPLHRFYHHSIRPSNRPFPKRLPPGKDLPEGVTMMFNELTQWFRWNFQVGSSRARDSHRCDVEAVRISLITGDEYTNILCIKHVEICGWFKMKAQTFWSFGSINPGLSFFDDFPVLVFLQDSESRAGLSWMQGAAVVSGCQCRASLEIRIASEGVQIWLKFLEEG